MWPGLTSGLGQCGLLSGTGVTDNTATTVCHSAHDDCLLPSFPGAKEALSGGDDQMLNPATARAYLALHLPPLAQES